MTPARKELLELIEELAECIFKLEASARYCPFTAHTKVEGLISLSDRVNAALANPPIIEETVMSVSIDPSRGSIDMVIDEDWLLHLAQVDEVDDWRQEDDLLKYDMETLLLIDQEHENGLTAQADEENLNRETQ